MFQAKGKPSGIKYAQDHGTYTEIIKTALASGGAAARRMQDTIDWFNERTFSESTRPSTVLVAPPDNAAAQALLADDPVWDTNEVAVVQQTAALPAATGKSCAFSNAAVDANGLTDVNIAGQVAGINAPNLVHANTIAAIAVPAVPSELGATHTPEVHQVAQAPAVHANATIVTVSLVEYPVEPVVAAPSTSQLNGESAAQPHTPNGPGKPTTEPKKASKKAKGKTKAAAPDVGTSSAAATGISNAVAGQTIEVEAPRRLRGRAKA